MDKRSPSRKEIALIGKFVNQLYPDLAKEITEKYIWPEPICSDYSLIAGFFDEFCRLKDILPDQIKGAQFKHSLAGQRRLFVSAMIRIYHPQLYNQGSKMIIKYGFNAYMSKFLKIARPTMHTTLRDCVNQENIYVEIREEVSRIVQCLLSAVAVEYSDRR